jgi:hypothetical protein
VKIVARQNGKKNLLPKYDLVAQGEEEYLIGECINAGLGWFVDIGKESYHTYTLKEARRLAEDAVKIA